MPLCLCVDGGGTKTRAAVVSTSTEHDEPMYASGEAGPSNLTFGVEGCLAATSEAVRAALDELGHPTSSSGPVRFAQIDRVWAGYAGCSRPADREALFPPLQALFPNAHVRLTSDAQLLTSPMRNSKFDCCVTLICGTGGLALAWRRDGDAMKQTGRSGGWGSLLGDEGSGWSMGKEAIKSVLTYAVNGKELLPWHHTILEKFGIADPGRLIVASSTLDTTLSHAMSDSERKKQIASCAAIVVPEASRGEAEALRIVCKIASEVVETLRPLVETEAAETSKTLLSLTGGLGRADVVWRELSRQMEEQGWHWGDIIQIVDPALDGVKSMMHD